MSFFDKKQEVIDIKITQFGKNLLARGFFKPVYYRFFDDDILYNSECAGFSEEQNKAEERIFDTQRVKTLYQSIGVETTFDHEQELIKMDKLDTFQRITKRQKPLLKDVMLRYPLESSEINSETAPRLDFQISGAPVRSVKERIKIEGIELPVPQINITSSYNILVDRRNEMPETDIAQHLKDSENYIDLTTEEVKFLNNSVVKVEKQDLVLDLQEFGVDFGLDNFEIEIFQIIEEPTSDGGIKENIEPLESKELIEKFFEIKLDRQVTTEQQVVSRDGRQTPRGRK